MSVKVMGAVFSESKQRSTRRLLLLGIADNADDYGHAWPGIDTLADKCLISRSLVIRATAQIEVQSNELLVYRKAGYGNHYLILTGKNREQRLDALQRFCAKLKITADMVAKQHRKHVTDFTTKHATVYAARKAKQRETHRLQSATRVNLTPPPCQPDTPPVYTGTPDPSLTVRETSKDSAAGAAATPKPRKRDELFDLVAELLFNAKPGDPAIEAIGGRVGKIKKALSTAKSTKLELTAACKWYAVANPDLTLPRDPEKVVTMILDFRADKPGGSNGNGQSLGSRLPIVRAQQEETA